MSFTITLMTNSSPPITVNKVTSSLTSLTGNLRDSMSVIDPVVIIDVDESTVNILSACNYFYIAEFKRYYFVKDITSVRDNLWEISGHCDVLSSWKTQLLANNGIVRRQENRWNLYLDDGVFKSYQDPLIKTISFPSGFNTQEYVLAIAGASDDNT